MPKKVKPINSIKRGMFPLRKKHTKNTLKSDVAALRKRGFPIKAVLHSLDVKAPKATKKSKKARGLSTSNRNKQTTNKR